MDSHNILMFGFDTGDLKGFSDFRGRSSFSSSPGPVEARSFWKPFRSGLRGMLMQSVRGGTNTGALVPGKMKR